MSGVRWFRLGDGTLGVESADAALRERFEAIYGDCAVADPTEGPRVVCRVAAPASGMVEVTFEDPEPLDIGRFVREVFAGRGYEPAAADFSGDGREMRFAPGAEWRPLVANLAVNRTLRLQRDVLFLHAASVAVGGRGLVACGPKRSGKTTLALALASRGHALFGDELAAVRMRTRELLPLRRSLAVRSGPAAPAAATALDGASAGDELFPDGELRRRAPITAMFPSATPEQVALTTVILLRRFVARPVAEPALGASPELLGHLTPLAASMWERPRAKAAMELLRLLAEVRVWWLDAGEPDETAGVVERLMENA